MPQIMTTNEVAEYLELHPITILKYASKGKIPAIRIGRVWRYDKDTIDQWIAGGATSKPVPGKVMHSKVAKKPKK